MHLQIDKNFKKLFSHGEFIDKKIEKEYFEYEINIGIKNIKKLILLLGIFYLLFMIPDVFLHDKIASIKMIAVNRSVCFILIVLLYIKIDKLKNYAYCKVITIYELLISVSFILIFHEYKNPDLLIQTLGVILIILAIFFINNRWINMIFVSCFLSFTFILLYEITYSNIKSSEFLASLVYILLVILINSMVTLQINMFKRMQFINNKRILEMSMKDPLTGVYNRLKFDCELEKCMNNYKNCSCDLSIIMFDIDNFKLINDNYGHIVGDEVLVKVAKLIESMIRKDDICARWGGEEFIVLMPRTNKDEGLKIAHRIKNAISNHRFNKVGKVTCSYGVTSLRNSDDINTLIQRVDNLLYMAKEAGKDTIIFK